MRRRNILIQNRLEVISGNVLMVPGCEPTSAFTSLTLAENRECNGSIVDLSDALEAIPGSTIVMMYNPRKLYFVLPEGPPSRHGCIIGEAQCTIDYYQILRDIGRPAEQPAVENIDEICSSFRYKGCF